LILVLDVENSNDIDHKVEMVLFSLLKSQNSCSKIFENVCIYFKMHTILI